VIQKVTNTTTYGEFNLKYILPENHIEQIKAIDQYRNHPARRQHHVTPIAAPLYVVTAIFNPPRYYTRYKLYQQFEQMVENAGGILYTIELALRDRAFEVTVPDNPHHIQLRTTSEIWSKELLLNLAIQRLPADWEYVATIDADVEFARPDWVNETLHQLQVYKIVQMFSHATDLNFEFEPINTQTGFVYDYLKGHPHPHRINATRDKKGHWNYPYLPGHAFHSGYAWAYRRSSLADLGGLGDIAILGSGDHHMACAYLGMVKDSIHGGMHQSFKDYWQEWQARSERHIKRNIGYVSGSIDHYFHGPKRNRNYNNRWKILVDEQFNYHLDLKKDVQGMYMLTDRNIKLRDKVREYFRSRQEDDIRSD